MAFVLLYSSREEQRERSLFQWAEETGSIFLHSVINLNRVVGVYTAVTLSSSKSFCLCFVLSPKSLRSFFLQYFKSYHYFIHFLFHYLFLQSPLHHLIFFFSISKLITKSWKSFCWFHIYFIITGLAFHISSVLPVEQPCDRSYDGESPQVLYYYYKVYFHVHLFWLRAPWCSNYCSLSLPLACSEVTSPLTGR